MTYPSSERDVPTAPINTPSYYSGVKRPIPELLVEAGNGPDGALRDVFYILNCDPREQTTECNCENNSHTAQAFVSETPKDTARRESLEIHVPFELTKFGNAALLDPYEVDSCDRVTEIGTRLAYRMHGLTSADAIFFGRHHVSILLARSIGRAPVQEAFTQYLRESGCPDLQVIDDPDGTMAFRNQPGFSAQRP